VSDADISLERSGITLERCTECGGIFLDRGELERLEEAEAPGLRSGPPGQEGLPAGSGSVQELIGELLGLARQYRGSRVSR
jgi:hypothetical protein